MSNKKQVIPSFVCLSIVFCTFLVLHLLVKVSGNAEGDVLYLLGASIDCFYFYIHVCVTGDALTVFKKNMIDPSGALQSWNPNIINPCTWFHVDCNEENSVIRL